MHFDSFFRTIRTLTTEQRTVTDRIVSLIARWRVITGVPLDYARYGMTGWLVGSGRYVGLIVMLRAVLTRLVVINIPSQTTTSPSLSCSL